MGFLKKHGLQISLLFILFSAGLLCFYAISNYNGNATGLQNRSELRNAVPGERSRPPETANRIQEGQFSGPDSSQRMASPPGGRGRGMASVVVTKYAPPLLVYAILFLVLFVGAYHLWKHKKLKIHPGQGRILILTLLCVGFLVRISAATLMEGHPSDMALFKGWATAAANNLWQVYSSSRSIDYPPLYIYVLSLIGKIASFPAMNPYFTLLLKLPSIVADMATSFLIYKLARKYLSLEISILAAAFYIFNPAVFINSTLWGQVDSFFTFIVASAVLLLAEKKTGPSSALFAAAIMMKPQGIIFLPVLFFELIRQKSFPSFLKAAVFSLGTVALIVLPFSLHEGALWIVKLFSNTVAEYPYASVNAFNLFGLLGANYTNDADTLFLFSYHMWGMIFIVLVTAFSWFTYMKGNSRVFAAAAALLQIAGVFILSARMHERYLFPAIALSILAFIYLKDKRLLLLSAGFSCTSYLNTHFVLFGTGGSLNSPSFGVILLFTSLLNVFLLVCLAKVVFDIAVKNRTSPLRC